MERHVGYLVDGAVVGTCCQQEGEVRIWRVNIEPYGQTCCRCGRTLVEPRTPAWPELYGGRACGHESVTTADGLGAFCRKCGETLA